MTKTLDIVIPIYNEEDCIDELIKRLDAVKSSLKSELDTRFIFVNDGSSDKSLTKLEELAAKFSYVKLVSFSRNFGHELAVIAGLDYSNADYTVLMDADLQDPPELIIDMYQKSKEGYQVVYGQRKKREAESFFKKFTAFAFYRLLNSIYEVKLPNDTGNFRLITAQVRNEILKIREHKRFLRGIAVWVGFKSAPVYYNRDARFAGETHYPLSAMLKLAFAAIFEMSTAPIALVNWLGILLLIASIVVFAAGNNIIATILLTGSIQIFAIAIIGAYVSRIYEESKGRPLYIVEKTINT